MIFFGNPNRDFSNHLAISFHFTLASVVRPALVLTSPAWEVSGRWDGATSQTKSLPSSRCSCRSSDAPCSATALGALCSGNSCAGESRPEVISEALRSGTNVSAQWPPHSQDKHCPRRGGCLCSCLLATCSLLGENLRFNWNPASALRLDFRSSIRTAALGDFSVVLWQVVPAKICLPCCNPHHFTGVWVLLSLCLDTSTTCTISLIKKASFREDTVQLPKGNKILPYSETYSSFPRATKEDILIKIPSPHLLTIRYKERRGAHRGSGVSRLNAPSPVSHLSKAEKPRPSLPCLTLSCSP